jgi:hypothetical protein
MKAVNTSIAKGTPAELLAMTSPGMEFSNPSLLNVKYNGVASITVGTIWVTRMRNRAKPLILHRKDASAYAAGTAITTENNADNVATIKVVKRGPSWLPRSVKFSSVHVWGRSDGFGTKNSEVGRSEAKITQSNGNKIISAMATAVKDLSPPTYRRRFTP